MQKKEGGWEETGEGGEGGERTLGFMNNLEGGERTLGFMNNL